MSESDYLVAKAVRLRSTPDVPFWKPSGPASVPVKRASGASTEQLLNAREASAARRASLKPRKRKAPASGFAGAVGTKPWVTARNSAADSW